MIFVPPEKRKPSVNPKSSFKSGINEIRVFNPLDSSMYTTRSVESTDEGLYESLPGDFDYLSDEQISGRMSRISLRDDEYDYFNCVTPVSEESVLSLVDSDDGSAESANPYVPPGVSPVPKRRPVRQKKTGLSHKRSITYVVKPTIIRAPSTLRRTPKKANRRMCCKNEETPST
ncbi:hypothetical protein JTB14_017417 [Gonioctena quinquepunctata]|nr:hypothetical protein JTB14_017417 [Gonioctena quinquepunctata]